MANIKDVEKIVNLVQKNDTLPREITRQFGTVEVDQENAHLIVMENEVSEEMLEVEMGVEIGEAILVLPSGLPQGSPIQVTFILSEDGRLDVKGLEVTDNRTVETSIKTTSVITKEEVEEAKKRSNKLQVS